MRSPKCDLCQDDQFLRYGNGEDRPCHACNADFYEREPAAYTAPTGPEVVQ